jgi:hypothetical protein
MTARLLSITAWLAVGHALLLGLSWALLQVPESNAAMLTVSVLVAASMVAVAGWVEAVGLAMWAPGTGWRESFRRARPAPLPAAIGLLVFGLLWMLTARAGAAWTAHKGEIDAWLMLHLAWTRTAGLHVSIARILTFVRFVIGALLVLTIVAWTLFRGFAALARIGAWLSAALSPRRVVLVTALFYGLVWLPWRAAFWRPAFVAPNWQEVAFVAVKLGVLYLVANVGWATILYLVEEGANVKQG